MYSFVTDSNGTEPWIRPLLSQNFVLYCIFFTFPPFLWPAKFSVRYNWRYVSYVLMVSVTSRSPVANSSLCSLFNSSLSLNKRALHKSLPHTPFVRMGSNALVCLFSSTSFSASMFTKTQRLRTRVPESLARISTKTPRFSLPVTHPGILLPNPHIAKVDHTLILFRYQ